MKLLTIATAAALLLADPALADDGGYTGNKLFANCTAPKNTMDGAYRDGLCTGFVSGKWGNTTLDVLNDLPRTRGSDRCLCPVDRGVAVLLTAAAWVIQRLPGQCSRSSAAS